MDIVRGAEIQKQERLGSPLCSRNARPMKALVGRAQLEQHGCPAWNETTSELGRIIRPPPPIYHREEEVEGGSVETRTMETTWSPHERIANRRDGNFLLTGLGAIRNRAGVLILLSTEILR